ncbi:MAG: TonB-dependent receptor [Bacteroidales bacterium]|jgi:iron complex outermembrane receptor protein|nr:TonB-dependent receptor [Bacteroidales bacterium]
MMRRLIFFALIAITVTAETSGQQYRGFIKGRVTDTGGNPLAGASVVIESLGAGVASDNDGNYILRGLREGSYSMRITFTGYEPFDTTVVLKGNAVADAVLNEALFVTEEVIVRSSRAGNRTPMAHTTVEASELRKNDMTRDMPFLLSLTPSVVETSDAGNGIGYTSLRIRGTDGSRINVTLDGIPLNDSESQQVFWVDLPDLASSTGSVQVQRGVGTSTNGAGAFGASVNISTITPPAEAGASAEMSAGSFNTLRASARTWTGDMGERFNMMIRASHISSDGYIEKSASDISSAMITGIWSAPSDRLKFNFITGSERTGISWWGVPQEMLSVNRRYNPAGEYTDSDGEVQYYDDETDNYKQNHYHLSYTHLFSSMLALNAALHLTTGLGYYEEQKSDRDPSEYGLDGLTDNGVEVTETDMVQRKWLDNNFYGAVWSLVRYGTAAEWTLGGALNRYDGDHFGNIIWMEYPGSVTPGYEWYSNNGRKDEFNIYGKVTLKVTGSISGFADMQYRQIDYRFTGADDDMKDLTASHLFRFINPKAGLFWSDGSGNDAFLSVSVAHREPTRSDFKEAAGDDEATPQPERLTDFEGGYSFRSGSMALSVNLYYMQYRDQLVPTGRISNTGYPVMTNVPESFRTGIELSGSFRPVPIVAVKANLTMSRSRIRDFRNYYYNYNTADWSEEYLYTDLGTVDIAYSPRMTGSAEIEVNPLKRLSLRLTGKYVGKQYFDNTMNKNRIINPYFVNNFSAAYKIYFKGVEEMAFHLAVNNVFNSLYENNAYGGMWKEDGIEKTWAYFFPQAVINFSAGISVIF